MKTFKSLAIYSLVLMVIVVPVKNVAATSDRETLEHIADKIDANYGGIYTWKGTAIVQRTSNNTKPSPNSPNERYLKFEYNYAFDRVKGDFISSSVLQDEHAIYAEAKKHLLTSNHNFLSKDGNCYSFEWYSNLGTEPLVIKGDTFSPINPDNVSRIVHLHKMPFSKVEMVRLIDNCLLFDPFAKFSSDRQQGECIDRTSAVDEIRAYVKGMHLKKWFNFAEIPQSHPDNIARLVTEGDKTTIESFRVHPQGIKSHSIFIFDARQGHNVVEHINQLTQADKVTQKYHWKCSYTQVDNFWVPKKTELEEFSKLATKVVVDWTSHKINEPISDSEFTLQKMGVCRGDQLYDRRTEKITIISGDDFPPFLRKGDKKDVRNVKFPFVRFVIITLGAVLIITSILNIYRKRKVSRKDVKK
ncbi:MAG: hypothetical protein LBC74_15605 [Planctomycetaceae bacterium]|nr:hypothetical protein [Planctomycetaceae bacterium]